MAGFNNKASRSTRTKVVTHSADAKKVSLAVSKYRKAHSSVSMFENKREPRYKGYKSVSLGKSQAKKFLINNTQNENIKLKSKRANFIKSASSPNVRNHGRYDSVSKNFKSNSNKFEAMDMLPVLRPESRRENERILQQRCFALDVQQAMSLAKQSINKQRDFKNNNDKTHVSLKNKNINNVNNQTAKQRNQQGNETIVVNSFFVSKNKINPSEEKLRKQQQIEYERSQMVERIKNISMKTAKKYQKRQLRRKNSELIEHVKQNEDKNKSKKVFTNVTKAITPRFGRSRIKSIRKKKNDGLKSHVKIKPCVSIDDAGENGDPYEAQRCQLCVAVPKASAGYKLVWMW
jgi:hypothetical protein